MQFAYLHCIDFVYWRDKTFIIIVYVENCSVHFQFAVMKTSDSAESCSNAMSLCLYITRKVNKVAKIIPIMYNFCFSHKGLSTKK